MLAFSGCTGMLKKPLAVGGLFVPVCSRLPCRRLPDWPIRKRSGVSVVEGRNHPKNDPKWCIDTNEPPSIHEGGSRRTFFAKPTFHAFIHPTRCVSTFSEPLRPVLPFPPFHPAWTIAFGRRHPFPPSGRQTCCFIALFHPATIPPPALSLSYFFASLLRGVLAFFFDKGRTNPRFLR
jgi:hypothetical protein